MADDWSEFQMSAGRHLTTELLTILAGMMAKDKQHHKIGAVLPLTLRIVNGWRLVECIYTTHGLRPVSTSRRQHH